MVFFKENINKIIVIVILFLLICVIYLHFTREREYIKTFDNGTKIIKIYSSKNIENIYPKIENEDNSDKIKKILNENGIDKFILNNGGNITAGKHYADEKYLVSIIKDGQTKDVILLENKSLYIYETGSILIAAINETLKDAEEDITDYLSTNKMDEDKAIYVIDKNKLMTAKFKKYVK